MSEERYSVFKAKKQEIDKFRELSKNLFVSSKDLRERELNIKQDGSKKSCFNLLSYQDVSHETIINIWPQLKEISSDVFEQIEIEAKYSGYIKRQLADIEVFKKDENLKIRDDVDYNKIGGLSREMVFKLSSVKPSTIGEASRIPGVTPAAITALLGFIKK